MVTKHRAYPWSILTVILDIEWSQFWLAVGEDTDSHIVPCSPSVLPATCRGVLMVGELVGVKEMCC